MAELEARNAFLEGRLALYREAVEDMYQGLCVVEPDGRLALYNSRYAQVLQLPQGTLRPGLTARELVELGMAAGNYPPGKTVEELEQTMWAKLSTRSDAPATLERSGRTFAVRPCRTGSGRYVATFDDITAQLSAEASLRASEARLAAILDAMPDCVKIFDESGRLIHINPKGLELLQAPDLESLTAPGYMA